MIKELTHELNFRPMGNVQRPLRNCSIELSAEDGKCRLSLELLPQSLKVFDLPPKIGRKRFCPLLRHSMPFYILGTLAATAQTPDPVQPEMCGVKFSPKMPCAERRRRLPVHPHRSLLLAP